MVVYIHKETFAIFSFDDSVDSIGVPDDYFSVDESIALPIQILNRKGYITEFCCAGHAFDSYIALKESGVGKFCQCGDPFHSNIVFKAGISLPTLPPGYVIGDWSGAVYTVDSSQEEKKRLKERLHIERYYANTGVYETLRDVLEAMEQLYEWTLSLPEFKDENR